MASIFENREALSRLWAALYCDFEKVIVKFQEEVPGWRYAHFAEVCKETGITLVLQMSVTKYGCPKDKDLFYKRMADMIFQLCKDFWLRPTENFGKRSDTVEKVIIKRSLAGFYLLYTMYEKQPHQGRNSVKISLGLADMPKSATFNEMIRKLPFYEEVAFMMRYLQAQDAFHYCVYADQFGFDEATRNVLNVSQTETVAMTKRMGDVQDVLADPGVPQKLLEEYHKLEPEKKKFQKDLLKTLDSETVEKHFSDESTFRMFTKTMPGNSLKRAMEKLDIHVRRPVATLESVSATNTTGMTVIGETLLKKERVFQKLSRRATVNPAATKRKEGYIFSKTKEPDEDHKVKKRREKGACFGNLWTFVFEKDFDKPCTGEKIRDADDAQGVEVESDLENLEENMEQ